MAKTNKKQMIFGYSAIGVTPALLFIGRYVKKFYSRNPCFFFSFLCVAFPKTQPPSEKATITSDKGRDLRASERHAPTQRKKARGCGDQKSKKGGR